MGRLFVILSSLSRGMEDISGACTGLIQTRLPIIQTVIDSRATSEHRFSHYPRFVENRGNLEKTFVKMMASKNLVRIIMSEELGCNELYHRVYL